MPAEAAQKMGARQCTCPRNLPFALASCLIWPPAIERDRLFRSFHLEPDAVNRFV